MNKTRRSLVMPIAAVAIAVVSGAFYNIYLGNTTSATEHELTMAATIKPSMTLTVDNISPNLNITPSSEGTFGATSINVGALSNGYIGYTLTMIPSSTSLIGDITNTTIPTLSASSSCLGGEVCTSNNFAPGRWGIAVNNGSYSAISEGATSLVSVDGDDTAVSNNNYTIYLGANLDLTAAIDNYGTTLTFTATPTIKKYNIAFAFDSGITGVSILPLDGGTEIGVIESGELVSLDYANTYIITPVYASGYSDGGSILTGEGLLENGIFTVGAGDSEISLSSIQSL